MTPFDGTLHPRGDDPANTGRWATKTNTHPDASLGVPAASAPGRTVRNSDLAAGDVLVGADGGLVEVKDVSSSSILMSQFVTVETEFGVLFLYAEEKSQVSAGPAAPETVFTAADVDVCVNDVVNAGGIHHGWALKNRGALITETMRQPLFQSLTVNDSLDDARATITEAVQLASNRLHELEYERER